MQVQPTRSRKIFFERAHIFMARYFFLILVLLMAIVPHAMAMETKEIILVRGDHDFAPFEYLDEHGVAAGFDVEILRAAAEVTGLRIDLRLGPWNEVRSDLENRRIDALAGMRYSAERDARVDFSAPYLINTSAVFVRKGSSIGSSADLRGKEIIVQRGDIMDDYVRDLNLSSNIIFVTSQVEALELLASGKHDAALCTKLRGLYLVRQRNLENVTVLEEELEGGPYGFAVAEGNQPLLARLNEGLRILKATGEYDEIYQRWFGLYVQESFFNELIRYALWVLTPILMLLAAAVAWSWTLKRQVGIKTREIGEHLVKRQEAEAKLHSERKFRQFVEASPVPMAIIDKNENIVYLNGKFSELFGYTLSELPDTQAWWSLACPDPVQRQVVLQSWGGPASTSAPSSTTSGPLEMEITCKGGALRHVSWRLSCVEDLHFIVFNDITERKRAEQALEYRSCLEAMISGISTRFVNISSDDMDDEIDRALQEIGEYIGVDRSYVFQFSREGGILSNTHEWCAPGIDPHKERLQEIQRDEFAWFLKQLADKGVFYCPSVRELGPEAQLEKQEWLREGIQSLISVPMVFQGEMVGLIGFDSVRSERSWPEEILFLLRMVGESFANALERRRGENELRLAHQQLLDIIDFLPDATFVVDRQGKVVAWNRAVEEMTGVSKEEMIGRGDHAYAVPFYGDRRPVLLDLIGVSDPQDLGGYEVVKREKEALVVEKFFPCVYGGQGAYVWAKASPLFDRDGNLSGAIESIRDITDRIEAQKQLEASCREMEAFVYTVSHDLRSPLTPIIGYADYIREEYKDRLDTQALKCLEEIGVSGHKMVKLMEDLLSLAKVGQLESPEDPVEADRVVQQVLENLSTEILKAGVNIVRGALPLIRVPETLLYQVFSNLIGNAVLYAGTAGGPIEIGGERSKETVLFHVRDHGPGIPAPERDRIFEVFFRGTGGRDSAGTGIGLATVRKIARRYGGEATVEETPGGGATFRVRMRDAAGRCAAGQPQRPLGD